MRQIMFTTRRCVQKFNNDLHTCTYEKIWRKTLIRMQCRQFVPRAAICTDKTLITLNVLIQMNTAMLRNWPVSHYATFSRVSLITCACSFEFKTLWLHKVLSVQISVNCMEPSYRLNVNFCLNVLWSCVKACADLVFLSYVTHSLLTKKLPNSDWRPEKIVFLT